MSNPRLITNEQLDRLYEIREHFLTIVLNYEDDEEARYYLDLCDSLLDELDPSSDYNTGDMDE